MTTPTIVDLRRDLPTAPGQGSGRTMTDIAGQVPHYSAGGL